ncbi:hypothetical protein LDO26_17685 [Luteimonas sp. BDR2-5]|uniref:hypothetical protein n=1 Tax=Proluteimonas luteida TaxID=2878685 RepID=UPI001E648F42|nr:hypothetical protein [Luteimonas sp. BDR2-5]MCD9030025.1 hypothetical protein [Luteimonas sp. BDR2-5]
MDEFIANAALLAGHLTQQCEKAAVEQRSSALDLRRAASDVGQSVADGKAELAQSARAAVREALSQEIPAAIEAVAQSGDRLRSIVDQLRHEHAATSGITRLLGFKALGALAIASIAIVGATGYVASNNLKRAERANVDAQVLEALAQVAITSCDGTPCVKLMDEQARWKKNDDYILLDTRQVDDGATP